MKSTEKTGGLYVSKEKKQFIAYRSSVVDNKIINYYKIYTSLS